MTPADWTALREAEQAAKDRRDAARSRQARANQHAEVHRALVLWRQMAIENQAVQSTPLRGDSDRHCSTIGGTP